jgi:hypothetical protein
MHPGLDRESARTLAELADGCPGRTRGLDHAGLLQLHRDILAGLLAAHASAADRTLTALGLAARAATLSDGLETLLDLLRRFFKEAMATLCRRRDQATHRKQAFPPDWARERWNLPELSDRIGAIDFALRGLTRNCNRQLVCEVLFLRLLAPPAAGQATGADNLSRSR